MGSFIVNVQVRATDRHSVVEAVKRLSVDNAWILPPQNGWATVLEEQASGQDDGWICKLTGSLSEELKSAAIAFLVHDSDFVCYWLFDSGRLVDEFNSCPGYFDDDQEGQTTGGDPASLLRYCQQGVEQADVARVLGQEATFAEDCLIEIAALLGIDERRAAADFNYADEDPDLLVDAIRIGAANIEPTMGRSARLLKFPGVGEGGDNDTGDDDDDEFRGKDASPADLAALVENVRKRMGLHQQPSEVGDPRASQLVHAAVTGNLAELERLVAAGANMEGLAQVNPGSAKAGRTDPLPGAAGMSALGLGLPMTPLLAALAAKQTAAVEKLIALGVDVNAFHPLFGTAVHSATTAGQADALRLLLDAGARFDVRNPQGQTPLEALAALRKFASQFAGSTDLRSMLPKAMQKQLDQLTPSEGWEACERLLRDAESKQG